MDDFSKYEEMRAAGATAEQVYLAAAKSGADFPCCLRLLRKVFGLSLVEAKEVIIVASGDAPSLSEYQERFLEPLKECLERERAEEKPPEN
jgi:hypothetical protein